MRAQPQATVRVLLLATLAALATAAPAAARPTDARGADDPALAYDVAEAAPVDTAHFRIHYVADAASADAPDPTDTSGAVDAAGAPAPNGVPDYVDAVAAEAEDVWQAEVVELGFAPPPADVARGGDARYDVYLMDFDAHGERGLLGLTVADPVGTRLTYLVLDDDYADDESPGSATSSDDRRRVSLAHEFFHAIQDGYGRSFASLPSWLAEGTATWMESQVYPQVDDNAWYLRSLVGPGTETPLWSSRGLHPYGTWWFVRAAVARQDQGAAWVRRLLARSGRGRRGDDAGAGLLASVSGGRNGAARLLRDYAVANWRRWFPTRLRARHVVLDGGGATWRSPARKLTALQGHYWRFTLPGRRLVVRVRADAGVLSEHGLALVLGGERVHLRARRTAVDAFELRGTVPRGGRREAVLVVTQAGALEGLYEVSAVG